ncbi:hypothetical protein DOTSEDRAFT_53648 [Dothistroma septosporum NZE10]|uniref:Uncharacterized protein n=1 Tax=Dothistroma septosporum (strain NZE10 / CBS 128990) TaxID=675120 RepID=N1PME5_DOTSN|nr:hypothetical protein DOTSEDRAFT_53648 [Dothistroma septosporum NZE10]
MTFHCTHGRQRTRRMPCASVMALSTRLPQMVANSLCCATLDSPAVTLCERYLLQDTLNVRNSVLNKAQCAQELCGRSTHKIALYMFAVDFRRPALLIRTISIAPFGSQVLRTLTDHTPETRSSWMGIDGGTYLPGWAVGSGGIGYLDVSASTQALMISTRVGSGSRTVNRAVSGTVGDPSHGVTAYGNLLGSGTLTLSPVLLRLTIEFDTAAWISLDNIQFCTFSRANAQAQTAIMSGYTYNFDGYAMTTYTVTQVIAGQSFDIELQGLCLASFNDQTACRVTVYSNKGGGDSETILLTGVWDPYTAPTSSQRFVN